MKTRMIGTGSFMPERIVSNDELSGIVDTSDEWIVTRTGIRERRIAVEETNTEMAAKAAQRAIEQAGISPEEIDLIIVATSSADEYFPNCACQVQKLIGAKKAVCFDLSAACSGFLFALNTLHCFITSGIYKTGIVIGVDVMSRLIDWSDRSTCVLFGDGAGAVVVKADEEGLERFTMGSDGNGALFLQCKSRKNQNFLIAEKKPEDYIEMNGQEVFKFAVKTVPKSIETVLSETSTDKEDIKYYVLHQANERIFEAIAKRLKEPMEKFPMNIRKYGNTSAASIPILLDELNREGKLNAGDKIVLAGFGAGLTWAASLLTW